MIRISTIFIAICMVLVAASLGFVLYSVAGISGSESAIVALTALTCLILVSCRITADLSEQVHQPRMCSEPIALIDVERQLEPK